MDQTPDWKSLLGLDPAQVPLIACPVSAIDDLTTSLPRDMGVVVRTVRGRRCDTPRELFHEWSAALQFPHYFGENWDAFEECLADLEWLPGDVRVVIVTEAEHLLSGAPEEFRTFAAIVGGILEEPPREGSRRSLRIVLQCRADRVPAVRTKFSHAGLRII